MNILFYTRESPYGSLPIGGAETSLQLLAESLAARGHTIIFLSNSRESSLFGFSKQTKDGVVVITTKRFSFPLFNSYSFKKITKRFKEKYIKKLFAKHDIDIVHTYYNLETCLFFLNLQAEIPFKLVVRIAGMQIFERVHKRAHFLKGYQRMFHESDLLNFISEGLHTMYQEKVHEIGVTLNKDKIFIKDIGVKVGAQPIWTPTDNSTFSCMMVSRFTKYAKRQDVLVKAMAQLADELPVSLTLVGSGPNVSHIKDLIKSLQLAHKVQIIDFLPQHELAALLLKNDLICHACDHEGLSKVIIESMGMGIPVLASNVAPLNTYINNDSNGFLVENTPEAWAHRISDIYKSREQLSAIGKNAYHFVSTHYSATKNAASYEAEFQKLIS